VDIVKGKALLQRALDAGDSNAYETLGDVSLAGAAGFDTDRDRAFGLLRKALSLGDTFAKVEIAIGLRPADFGRRITQAEAASFMRTGTAAMLPRRYYSLVLGDFEIGIHGNTPDYADAVPRLKTGLVFKDVHTDENLAFCYLNGLGVTKDPEQAKKYLKAAVAEGSSWATSELADMSDDRSARSALNANQQASDYEGYHWSELHPMTQMPQPGSPADPNPH
jgi:TPR repeat protein